VYKRQSKDSLSMIENVLSKGIADLVLTGGLVAQLFLSASGRQLGGPNEQILKDKGFEKERDRAKKLLSTYGEKIRLPADLAVEKGGRREEVEASSLPVEFPVKDVGSKTIREYSELIRKARTVVANGPLGVFEQEGFERGTVEVLKAMADSEAYTIIGGGHMVAAAEKAGVLSKIRHVSTGGGACISFLAGEPMPVVELLLRAKT